MEINRFLLSLVFVLLLVGVVSAVSVDITKLNDNEIVSDYGVNVTRMSFIIDGVNCINVSDVWYSLDGGIVNISKACSDGEIILTGLSSNQGDNTWEVYIEDNEGNVYSDSVSFWVDSIAPVINVLSPDFPLAYTSGDTFDVVSQLIETNPYEFNLGEQIRLWLWDPNDGEFVYD